MTCGLCHRDAEQHSLSSSGPTRYQYTRHRAACPGTILTKCAGLVVDGCTAPAEAPASSENEEEKVKIKSDNAEAIKKLEDELKKLKFDNESPATPQAPTPDTQTAPLHRTGLQLVTYGVNNNPHSSNSRATPLIMRNL